MYHNKPSTNSNNTWTRGDWFDHPAIGIGHVLRHDEEGIKVRLRGADTPEWYSWDEFRGARHIDPPKAEEEGPERTYEQQLQELDEAPEEKPTKGKGRKKGGKPKGGSLAEWRANMKRFVDVTMRRLRPLEVKVWIILCSHTVHGLVSLSQREMAELAGASQPKVCGAINALVAKGLLEVEKKGRFKGKDENGQPKGESSVYRVYALMPIP